MNPRQLIRLLPLVAAVSACTKKHSTGPTSADSTIFVGVLNNGSESGALMVTIKTASLAPPIPATSAAFSATGTVNAAGTLQLVGAGVPIGLTGTYASPGGPLATSGGGYSLTGTYGAGVISGTYTGPQGSGAFIMEPYINGAATACGTFASQVATPSGNFDLAISGSGAVGLAWDVDQPLLLAGSISGDSLHLTGNASIGGTMYSVAASGTVSGTSVRGTYSVSSGGSVTDHGSWIGAPCSGPPVGLRFAGISAGGTFACGITTAAAAYCWGNNYYGQLGIGTATGPQRCGGLSCSLSPLAVTGGLSFATLSPGAGSGFACGITTDHVGYCWGENSFGELGTGDRMFSASPVPIVGGLRFLGISAGALQQRFYTCGVTTTNVARCWGNNYAGVLGIGSTMGGDSLRPVPVAGGLPFSAVSTGYNFACGVTTGGAAYCWGDNVYGELGIGTMTPSDTTTPTPVATALHFASVSAGYHSACGLTAAGAAYCWGWNYYGELGSGSSATLDSFPEPVAGGLTFTAISAGSGFACGITTSHAAYCWGLNNPGQLGNGTTSNSATPVAVAGGLSFATVSAGAGFACGVTTSGAAYCWGTDGWGELGNGTLGLDTSVPVRVGP